VIEAVLSDEGWPYASAPPVEPGDPGRYHALFGRDALITALQLLPERPEIARATLRALALRQGTRCDEATLEEPGKIGHEFRAAPPESFVAAGWPPDGEFSYYGTADATAWFLIVLAASGVSGCEEERDAAAGWLAAALDDGDGLVRHVPGGRGGLGQQGWRDTIDAAADQDGGGYVRADGSNPAPPLADADTQAVTHAALRALAHSTGDAGWTRRADALRTLVSERYGPEVMALEAGDVVVGGAGSQLGWLLWADALEPAAATAAAARLCEPDLLTSFGLRTLASSDPNFGPAKYHRGAIWPFDSWLGWGGLRAAGRLAEAERVRTGVLAALDRLGRAPELYAVELDGTLAPIALSNRVQAWTIGARWALEHEWDGRGFNPDTPMIRG
jgi:glycogen debranching enzyme